MKRIVILSTQPPYGSSLNAEGFRSALGLVFTEFVVDIILVFDGVYALLKDQEPRDLQMKSIGEVYQNIGQYNINLFVDEESIKKRHLSSEQLIPAQLLGSEALKSKLNTADVVLTF